MRSQAFSRTFFSVAIVWCTAAQAQNTGRLPQDVIGVPVREPMVRAAAPAPKKPIPDALVLDGKKVPIPPELTKWLDSEGYATLTLTNEAGQVKIVNIEGTEIKPCGRVEGTTITGECHLDKVNVLEVNTVTTWMTEYNPKCMTKRVAGHLLQVHANKKRGHWKRGDFACHPGKLHDHGH